MTQNFYSQASNFTGSQQSEVDIRTGLYKSNFPIVSIAANHGIGPVQDITLSYLPLDSLNRGFGQGWSLGLTYYDKLNGLLVTANGDQYKIVENSSSVLIQENKLDNIKFQKFADHYKLIYKTGVVEILSSPTSVNNIKVPQTIYSPVGRALNIQWNLATSYPQLQAIKDEDNTLLKITYSGFTAITVWPGSIEEKNIRIIQTNNQLTSFSILKDTDSPQWNLQYQTIGTITLLKGMSTPSGMSESVIYVANQIQFPGTAKQASLPRVTSHTRSPGALQPPITRTYQYSTNNFLGYGLTAPWSSGSDYLYNIAVDYKYWSEERMSSADELIVTRRVFDKFHLLREEKILQSSSQQLTTTDYYAIENATYDQQPGNFLCQKNKVVTFSDIVTGAARSEITTYEYSTEGNILSQTESDGKKTSWEYYPATASAECPADPHGFCRYIKREIITPAPSDFTAVIKVKYYTYSNIAVATGAKEHLERAVVKSAELSLANDNLLMRVVPEYLEDNSSPYYGRVNKKTIEKAGEEGEELNYVSVEETTWQEENDFATRDVIFYPYDYNSDNSTSTKVTYYPLSLKEFIVTDSDGNTLEYHYDEQDRIIQSIKNKNTEYEANVYYSYQMEELEEGVFAPVMVVTDEKGNISKNIYDGLGNLIQQLKLINNVWMILLTRQYDEFGREHYNERHDQYDDVTAVVSQTMSYNNWGIVNCISYNDGHYEYNEYNPITLQAMLWQESPDAFTGKVVTTYNVNGDVIAQAKIDEKGESIGLKKLKYDGLRQLREILDENNYSLSYEYDSYGRVKNTILADGTIIRKFYAPHTTEKLTTRILVNGQLIGEQKFDGLGRLKESNVANRLEQYFYDYDSKYPYQTIRPDGEVLQYEYIPELAYVVKKVKDGNGLILQELSYDPATGDVLSGQTVEGARFVNTYNSDSSLSSETITDNGRTVSTGYTFSPQGVLTNYVGVANDVRHLKFNTLGQCWHMDDGAISTENEFDTLGRVSKITTKDNNTNVESVVDIIYDYFGREWIRNFKSGNDSRSIEQLYFPDDKLQTRITRQGDNVLLTENYSYTNRNQLYTYSATGSLQPTDKYGNSIQSQVFTYDELGNIQSIQTIFSEGVNDAVYYYDQTDPCQLKRISNSHSSYPLEVILKYDLSGRLTINEVGHQLAYDNLGRISHVQQAGNTLATYRYDALDRLIRQDTVSDGSKNIYYRGESVVAEYDEEASQDIAFVKIAENMLANVNPEQTQIFLTDFKGTPLSLIDSHTRSITDASFTAFGSLSTDVLTAMSPAFNGKLRDAVTGYYHLGNGYRAYNPELMRFNTPDSWSPFGFGGINPYAYCQNDPINFVDPTGHMSWQAGVSIGLSVLSLVLTIVTAGAAIIVAGGVAAAAASAGIATIVLGTVGVIGDVASITSTALEETNPELSNAFGWVSKACSIISFGSVIPKVPGYIKQAPETIVELWSKARGHTGSYVVNKIHDTRGLLIKTADRYLEITDSTAFSVAYHVATGGTRLGVKVYDFVSQKKEDSTSAKSGSQPYDNNNVQPDSGDLKSLTRMKHYYSSNGMQTVEETESRVKYVSRSSDMTDALSPLVTQLKQTGVRLVNKNSLVPWFSTVKTNA
ncbi:RHS repeat domain-containing protein [Pseudocitrobacter corydidari]|uniref:Teneurin-like YD-shell domain-containing protein n=1 Tax=Pseudocitrobacter corydidari TaxID=2891570 RepID=A0ABY3S626_9ENTR|nr:RHS repeat-associated core domain-containing protein [Pseudocitrobacter corydidari]UGS42162.1 hypothetical protein G163CM_28870 [Pseudocitrobacter corydidari]